VRERDHVPWTIVVEVTRQHVIDALHRAGYGDEAERVTSSLPDSVDLDQAALLLLPYGITKSELISRMGGSP
jgi:hypothetical protein